MVDRLVEGRVAETGIELVSRANQNELQAMSKYLLKHSLIGERLLNLCKAGQAQMIK